MARWSLEPGHTAAEFCVRHMMVTHVRGHFKNVHGSLEFDPGQPEASRVEATIDTPGLWSGEPGRDVHLRGPDFLDVEHFPEITFTSRAVHLMSPNEAVVTGALTIRGVTKVVGLDVHYLGQWETPWWEDGVDKGPKTRAGFVATARIDRRDFGVSWNSPLARGGIVVGHQVLITIDAEAILES
ncbi:MAG TPA: YceI family protein [Thermoanaerobaculia bacterium]|nr:YceI family protein [Thermoanaerobaculia bacterium]